MPAQDGATKQRAKTPRLRRTRVKQAELLLEARELRRKFQEWEESYHSPARRMAYIRSICNRIANGYQPENIILFGSHAYGKPTSDSDVDLLIVMDFEGRPIEQIGKIRSELGLVTPIHLLIRTPREVRERLRDGDMFMIDILERGKLMYEAKHG